MEDFAYQVAVFNLTENAVVTSHESLQSQGHQLLHTISAYTFLLVVLLERVDSSVAGSTTNCCKFIATRIA